MLRNTLPLLVTAFATLAPVVAQQPLPSRDPRGLGFDPALLDEVGKLIEGTVRAGKLAGAQYVIARDGRIADWRTFGHCEVERTRPMQKDTICRIYSMSKVVTAVAALQLVERGQLRLDDPIARWLPGFAKPQVFTGGTADAPQLAPAERPITVRMLLNHTSGLTYDFGRTSPVNEIYRRADLWKCDTLEQFLDKVAALPLLAQPGTAYHYSVSDDVLGAVIEKVAGVPLAQFVQQNICTPLGMVDTDYDVPQDKMARLAALCTQEDGKLRAIEVPFGAFAETGRGFAAGGAGMFGTIGDYLRFGQMLLGEGQLDGVRILGRKTFELAQRASLPAGQQVGPGDSWGLFSAVRVDVAQAGEPSSQGMLYWSGAATTHFFVDQEERLVALLFAQHLPYDQPGLLRRFRTAVYRALQ